MKEYILYQGAKSGVKVSKPPTKYDWSTGFGPTFIMTYNWYQPPQRPLRSHNIDVHPEYRRRYVSVIIASVSSSKLLGNLGPQNRLEGSYVLN